MQQVFPALFTLGIVLFHSGIFMLSYVTAITNMLTSGCTNSRRPTRSAKRIDRHHQKYFFHAVIFLSYRNINLRFAPDTRASHPLQSGQISDISKIHPTYLEQNSCVI